MISNQDFMAHAFKGCGKDETPWIASFPGDVATAPHSVWFGAAARPLPSFVRDGHNNYVCISTFERADDGRYRRRKDCWAGLWMVLFDDLGSKVQFERLLLEPSCLVETSPGNFQAWLLLKTPERNRDKAEALINGLIAAGASDPGAGNLTRYGRLPVGCNGKAKHASKGGKPFKQRVHSMALDRRYSMNDIATAYGIKLRKSARSRKAKTTAPQTHDGYLGALEWAGLYLEPLRGKADGHRIICPWHRGHTSQDTSGTVYFSPSPENDGQGGFHCHHGHCRGKSIHDLTNFIAGLMQLRDEKRATA